MNGAAENPTSLPSTSPTIRTPYPGLQLPLPKLISLTQNN